MPGILSLEAYRTVRARVAELRETGKHVVFSNRRGEPTDEREFTLELCEEAGEQYLRRWEAQHAGAADELSD